MTQRLMATWFLLLMVCLPISVSAYGKTTVDPNAGRTSNAEKMLENGDVTQKVTYEAKRKTVASILDDLSKMTGVTLKAGYNNEDWQVRDRRMNIFAKDIPLANLMNSIARVMKFKWSKSESDGGNVSYKLYMDRKTLLGAERQRYIEEEQLKKRQTEGRQRLLSGLEDAVGMSEEDMEKLKLQSPYIYMMAKQGWANSIPSLFAEVPAAKQAFLSNEVLTIDTKSLSPNLRQMMKTTLTSSANGGWIQGLLGSFDEGSITINSGQILRGYNTGAAGIVDVKIKSPGDCALAYFDDPESTSAKLDGDIFIKLMSASTPEERQNIIDESSKDIEQARAIDAKDLGEPLAEHTDDPDLSVKVKIKMEGNDFADILSSFAKSSSFAVVSDSFEKTFWDLTFPAEEIKVRAVLDKIESVCRYNWEKHGSTLELHDRDWFRKRAAQIPEAWLEAWRKALKDDGSLDLSELSHIAMLTAEQFWTNILPDEVLGQGGLAFSITVNQDILRFYAALDKQQQALIFTEQGLNLDYLANDQSLAVQTLLQRCSALRSTSPNGLRLLGTHHKDPEYTFRVVTSSGENTAINWIVQCGPPAKEKPKDEKSQQKQ